MRENTDTGRAGDATTRHVYKVLRPAEWESLQRHGRFAGSPDDQQDRFIHLSCWSQVSGTLARHFSRSEDREVVVAALPVAAIGGALRWEASRGGALFPHLYAELSATQVSHHLRLVRSADGTYPLPEMEPL